jgi:hypothetical protein
MSVAGIGGNGVVPNGAVSPHNEVVSSDRFLGLPASVQRRSLESLPHHVRALLRQASPSPPVSPAAAKTRWEGATLATDRQLPAYMTAVLVRS